MQRKGTLSRFVLPVAVALVLNQWIQLLQWTQSSAFAQVQPPPNDQLPLLSQSSLNYLGAFRVTGGSHGSGDNPIFDYTQGPIAYCPEHNSIYMVGHTYDQAVAEISIPNIVNSSNIGALNT